MTQESKTGFMIYMVKREGKTTVFEYVSDHEEIDKAESNVIAYKESTEYEHTEFTIIPF